MKLLFTLIRTNMMKDAILNFPKQFNFEPEIKNHEKITSYDSYVVCGMGGSHLAADLLPRFNPELNIIIHSDYGLPTVIKNEKILYIFSSYSGNTEEVIDGYNMAKDRGLSMAAVGVGGKLIEMAKKDVVPYVELPHTHIQPRCALGFSLIALSALIGQDELLGEFKLLSNKLKPADLEKQADELAGKLFNKIPIIYASNRNRALAYNWKIKFNETGKIPAFQNVFPELNHNEMTGFDINDNNRLLSEIFDIIFIKDNTDSKQNKRRIEVTINLYEKRGVRTTELQMNGESEQEKIFNSLLLADWIAVKLAEKYGSESEAVPMVEEFKKMI